MSLRIPWLIGSLLLLFSAPAQATPCDHSCGAHGESQRKEHHNASSIRFERSNFGDRQEILRASLHAPSLEFSVLSKVKNETSRAPLQARKDDLSEYHSWKLAHTSSAPDMPFQSAVPEPTAVVLFGVGLLFTQAATRRRRA